MSPRAYASTIATIGGVLGALIIASRPVMSAHLSFDAVKFRTRHIDQIRVFRGARPDAGFSGTAARPFRGALAVNTQDGVATLQRMLTAEMRINSDGEQTTRILRNGSWVVSTQRVTRQGDSGLKIVWESPPNMQGSLTVDNDDRSFHYDAARHRLKVSPTRLKKREAFGERMLTACSRGNIIVTVAGNDMVAGRQCTIVEIRHKTDVGPSHTFWVDNATGFPLLKMEEHAHDGHLLSSSFYTAINLNAAIPPGAFVPPNVPVTAEVAPASREAPDLEGAEREAGLEVLQPQFLPPGYHYLSAAVSDYQRQKMVEIRYVNGFDVISLFETPAISPRPNAVRLPAHVATTVIGRVKIVLVGNLPRADLDRIVASLR